LDVIARVAEDVGEMQGRRLFWLSQMALIAQREHLASVVHFAGSKSIAILVLESRLRLQGIFEGALRTRGS
jgi:hypothetical protein